MVTRRVYRRSTECRGSGLLLGPGTDSPAYKQTALCCLARARGDRGNRVRERHGWPPLVEEGVEAALAQGAVQPPDGKERPGCLHAGSAGFAVWDSISAEPGQLKPVRFLRFVGHGWTSALSSPQARFRLRGMDAAWLSPLPPLRGMDSEVSFESLTEAWISPVLSGVALDVRGGETHWSSRLNGGLGNAVSNRSTGRYPRRWRNRLRADAEAQARESNNNNPAKPNCGALTARFHASRMTSGSLSCWLSSSVLYPPA